MKLNYKNIHIGSLISLRVSECGVEMPRICNFLKCKEEDVLEMYKSGELSTQLVLKWCKLLEYDFFRLYSQHLILFSPPSSTDSKTEKSELPEFRKKLYTYEIVEFILELVRTGEKTKAQIIRDYNIPKTTLYKWISKYDV